MPEDVTPPRSALLVIDVQEDFCEPNGSLAVKGGRELSGLWNHLLSLPFAVKIASKDWHPADHISFASQHQGASPFTSKHTIANPDNPEETFTTTLWPDHCVQNTSGADIIPELDQTKLDHVIQKGQDIRLESYSAFGPPYRSPRMGSTDLEKILEKEAITHVFVVGLAYDFCVKSTAVDAAELGFKTFVIEDGTRAATEPEKGIDAFRAALADKGVVVISSQVLVDGQTKSWQDQLREASGLS